MVRKIKPTKDEKKSTEPQIDAPDEFLSLSQRGFDWISANGKLVIGILAVLLLGGVAYASVNSYIDSQSRKASDMLAETMRLQKAQIDLTGDVEATEDAKVFASEEAKTQAVRESAESLISAFPDTQSATVARLILGRACLETSDLECAKNAYEKSLSTTKPEDPIRAQALLGLGAVLEQSGDQNAAVDAFKKLADGMSAFQKDLGLYHAGRIMLALEQKDQARTYLERIESDFPESPMKSEANKLLESLK